MFLATSNVCFENIGHGNRRSWIRAISMTAVNAINEHARLKITDPIIQPLVFVAQIQIHLR